MANFDSVNLSDEELVQRYRNSHDSAYVGELYIRYTHLVYGVCLKYLKNDADAQDATMQIFEKLLKELKKHHIAIFKPWLYTVVKNHCMMEFRKESQIQKNSEKLKKELQKNVEIEPTVHLTEENEKELILKKLEEGMYDLKDEQKLCVEQFYLMNKSYQQIADEHDFTINEVKSFIQNGKRNLKIYMTQK